MYDKLKKAIYGAIEEGITNDFWGEDSAIIDAHAETTGVDLDCEGLSIYPRESGGLNVEVGELKFVVKVGID